MAKSLSDVDQDIRDNLTKNLGSAAFDSPTIKYWAPSGSLILDQIIRNWQFPKLGQSGYPGGKWVELYGRPGGGKTAVACRAARACQEAGGLVIYINTSEQGFSPDHASKIGVSLQSQSFMLVNAFSLESCFQSIEDLTKEYFDADFPILFVIDSLSGLGCQAYTVDESQVKAKIPSASGAKFLHEWFRRGSLFYQSGSKITVIFIRL